MIKLNPNKFVKFSKNWKNKHTHLRENYIHLPAILNQVCETKIFKQPKDLKSLHNYFKKISEHMIYLTIFNGYHSTRSNPLYRGKYFHMREVGVLTLKKHKDGRDNVNYVIYYENVSSEGTEFASFGIEKKYKNFFPNHRTLLKICDDYLQNDLSDFFDIVNFNSILLLDHTFTKKELRNLREEYFNSKTKINYEFVNKF